MQIRWKRHRIVPYSSRDAIAKLQNCHSQAAKSLIKYTKVQSKGNNSGPMGKKSGLWCRGFMPFKWLWQTETPKPLPVRATPSKGVRRFSVPFVMPAPQGIVVAIRILDSKYIEGQYHYYASIQYDST
jgi:hypothetical protein